MGGIIKVGPLSKPERWEAGRVGVSLLVKTVAILLQEHKMGKENRIESSRKKQHLTTVLKRQYSPSNKQFRGKKNGFAAAYSVCCFTGCNLGSGSVLGFSLKATATSLLHLCVQRKQDLIILIHLLDRSQSVMANPLLCNLYLSLLVAKKNKIIKNLHRYIILLPSDSLPGLCFSLYLPRLRMPGGSAYIVFSPYVLYQPLDKDSAQAGYNILLGWWTRERWSNINTFFPLSP